MSITASDQESVQGLLIFVNIWKSETLRVVIIVIHRYLKNIPENPGPKPVFLQHLIENAEGLVAQVSCGMGLDNRSGCPT